MEQRDIRLTTSEEADSLATFLATLLTVRGEAILRYRVVEFLDFYPHPAAADSLWHLIEIKDGVNGFTRGAPLRILAALGDPRVAPMLVDQLEAGSEVDITLFPESIDHTSMTRLKELASTAETDSSTRNRAGQALAAIKVRSKDGVVDNFELPTDLRASVARDGFAVAPSGFNEMFELYGPEYPFVTTDVMWHTWMILMRAARDEMERLVLAPRVKALSLGLMQASLKQPATQETGDITNLVQVNAAFFAVPVGLLSGDATLDSLPVLLPEKALALARGELEKIRKREGIDSSRVLDRLEDYTRYEPPGAGAPVGWHGAMTFYGRMSFRLDSDAATKRAILILSVMEAEPDLHRQWKEIDRILKGLFGEPDDFTLDDYRASAHRVALARYGSVTSATVMRLAGDPEALQATREDLNSRPHPRIATDVMDGSRGRQPGLRILGQRYTRPIEFLQRELD
ncbi:MAG: hypothetical protein FD129_195, partial [bacterium]